jgi:taurine dioxygenase
MTTMPFTVEPMSADFNFGKIVHGLRAEHLKDEAVRSHLRHLWIHDGVVVFRDGDVNEDIQVDLSSVFGELEAHPLKGAQIQRRPELITIFSKPEDASIFEVDGQRGSGFIGWHSDLIYVERINHGGIMRSLKPTTTGGLTGFLDQIAAYDALPERLKQRIADLNVVYKLGSFHDYRYGYRDELKVVRVSAHYQKMWDAAVDFPPSVHPMVFVQPETGRKVLNISPFFASHIEGMENAEGNALLKELCDHINDCPSYHHKWTTNEMVLWDNWRMLHCASPFPSDQERVMQRTTIKGDYGRGRKIGQSRAA